MGSDCRGYWSSVSILHFSNCATVMLKRCGQMTVYLCMEVVAALSTKTCPCCRRALPRDAFHTSCKNKDGLQSYCKSCSKIRTRDRSKTPARREWHRRWQYADKYGLTIEQYDQLLVAQNNSCTVCDVSESGRMNRYFCVDHDHTTGYVRGLLCHRCNAFRFRTEAVILRFADYLRSPPAYNVIGKVRAKKYETS